MKMPDATFRTALPAGASPLQIGLDTPLVSIGFCFAEHMGRQLADHKFDMVASPMGTVFHPLAAFRLLHMALEAAPLEEEGFVLTPDGLWAHLDLHTQFSAETPEAIAKRYAKAQAQMAAQMRPGGVVLLTFGTALQYRHLPTSRLVSNCHKMPSQQFEKTPTPVAELVAQFQRLRQQLPDGLRIILSVSPVRHLRDGLPLNSVSKAILRLACHQMADEQQVFYFPAYEALMDDLRDYRFYEADMLHPNSQAIDYVWQLFQQCYFSEPIRHWIRQWSQIRQAMAHRPQFPHSSAYRKHLIHTAQRLEQAAKMVDVNAEMDEIRRRISDYENN